MVKQRLQQNIPISTNFDLFSPDVGVQTLTKVLIHNWTVLVLDDTSDAIPDEKARSNKAEENSEQGKNGNPFLLGAGFLEPWFLDLARFYSSRVKVSVSLIDLGARFTF